MKNLEKKQNAKFVGATIGRPHFEGITKGKNGITLIALIITIIVMMILVGITVSVALNGGLFNTASSAAKTTEKEAEKEELQSAIVAAYDAVAGTVDGNKLQSNLPGWTVEGEGPFTCTSPKENKFKMTINGVITEIEKEQENSGQLEFLSGTYYGSCADGYTSVLTINKDTAYMTLIDTDVQTSDDITWDKENQTLKIQYGSNFSDYYTFRYYITDDDVLLSGSSTGIFSTHMEESVYNLDGEYVYEGNNGFSEKFTFVEGSSEVLRWDKYSADGAWSEYKRPLQYASWNDLYFLEDYGEIKFVDNNLKSFIFPQTSVSNVPNEEAIFINSSAGGSNNANNRVFKEPDSYSDFYGNYQSIFKSSSFNDFIEISESSFIKGTKAELQNTEINEEEKMIRFSVPELGETNFYYTKNDNETILTAPDLNGEWTK